MSNSVVRGSLEDDVRLEEFPYSAIDNGHLHYVS